MSNSPNRPSTLFSLLCTVFLAVGCGQQLVRESADAQLRAGQYEQAVSGLTKGLRKYPESNLLRAGLLQTQNEALARLLVEASTSRAAGRLVDAEKALQRALPFDTSGQRVKGLLVELETERRQREALTEAEALVQAKRPDAALRVVKAALKDNPRQGELLALQRRLESDLRRVQLRHADGGLAETRPITLDFRDANLRTVLDVVTRHSGVNFILDKDVRADLRITTHLRSVKVEDAIDLVVSTHQLAKKVVDTQTVLIYPNTPEKQREHQEQVVRVFYLASAEAKGAAAFLRSMLRLRDAYVDERSNMLAIREPAGTVELAERLIALYDSPEPEVLLELEVIEVRTNRLTDLGIKFPDSIGLTPLSPAGVTGLTLGNIRGLTEDRVGLSVAGLLINLKREVGDLNTLANPRIRARNREKARVLIGDKVPIISATTGQGGFVSDSVSYLDVGLKLEVEPTVYADDEVAIKINLEVSSLAREVRTSSGSLAYQIGTRSAATTLRLRDGETQLLAGLISREERGSASGIPGLSDLPLAGRLFSAQRDETQRTELVLAITPRVLRNIRRAEASETELWIGTEMSPRLRTPGGNLAQVEKASAAPDGSVASAFLTGPALAPQSAPQAQMGGPITPRPTPPLQLTLKLQGPTSAKIGETFTATVEMTSPARLRGAPLQLRYPPSQLQVVAVEEGEFFKADGAATSFTHAVDVQSGALRVGVLRNQATGIDGQGALMRLRLKALAAGMAELSVASVEPVSLGDTLRTPQTTAPLRIEIKP